MPQWVSYNLKKCENEVEIFFIQKVFFLQGHVMVVAMEDGALTISVTFKLLRNLGLTT